MKLRTLFLTALLFQLFFLAGTSRAQVTFYDTGGVQNIEIFFSETNWDYMMDTAKAGSGSYIMAQWVKINGVQFDSVGVKYKGTSSYDPEYNKNPLHISLDEYKDQSYQGFASIKLANCYGDPSMIREVLSYEILADYMDCSRSNFASVFINDTYIGLYSNDESVNKKFCSSHFYSSDGTFIKCNPEVAGPFSKSNLKYISSDSSDYFPLYGMESGHGWNDLVELCDVITNNPSAIGSNVDIDRAIWMLAFNNSLVSLDSYSGWFSQNHYLYRDATGLYDPIIWDLNMSFGGFPYAGAQGGGSGSLTVQNMQQLTAFLHSSHSDWPLIVDILGNATWKRMYVAHMKTILEEAFASGGYITKAGQLRDLIEPYVWDDTNKFFSYEEFLFSMTEDVSFGSYVVPGISNLMEARTDYLAALPEFTAAAPAITAVAPINPSPLFNTQVTINATVTGNSAGGVYLGYRLDKADKFYRVNMYDDGLHNDGAAGDNVYGQSFIISSLEAQYYIYAENNDAGLFSPQRAEHEFYELEAQIQTAGPGDVLINEFLAKNTGDTINEYGNYEDWIELYNTTNGPLNLFGLYFTDDMADPGKFAFPDSTFMEPHGYLVLWADEENSTSTFIHCNFKLSANGEALMLSDGAGTVFDSITFGPQTEDISTGRCPDGSGPFGILGSTTFNGPNNCPAFTPENVSGLRVEAYPNPTRDHLVLHCQDEKITSVEIFNSAGIKIAHAYMEHGTSYMITSELPSGIYFYRLIDLNNVPAATGKFIILK
jgi:spore coat protein CotH